MMAEIFIETWDSKMHAIHIAEQSVEWVRMCVLCQPFEQKP